MTSAMAACLAARDQRAIHSMSIGVCMLEMQKQDMEMSAFASDEVYERVKARSRRAGILRGHELALSMLWLRPGDLIWHNVVNNYLLGNEPPEFDLLYWNNDWTNLPAKLPWSGGGKISGGGSCAEAGGSVPCPTEVMSWR